MYYVMIIDIIYQYDINNFYNYLLNYDKINSNHMYNNFKDIPPITIFLDKIQFIIQKWLEHPFINRLTYIQDLLYKASNEIELYHKILSIVPFDDLDCTYLSVAIQCKDYLYAHMLYKPDNLLANQHFVNYF